MLCSSVQKNIGNVFGRSTFIKCHRYVSTNSTLDDQFIQRSKMPTMHFQPSLPRLPVPELPKSCARYLRAQRPLLNDNDYARVDKIIKRFETSEGPQLQKELVQLDLQNIHTSYISAPWFDMYLRDRKPLPINYNPALVLINDPKPVFNDQLVRATNLLVSSLRFLRSLRNSILEPEVFHLNPKKSNTNFFRTVTGMMPSSISWYGAYLFKAFPLDMSQYKNLFNTSRIPKIGKDELYHDPSQRHIMVMKGGNFYSVQVLDESGSILDTPTLYNCLKYIMNDNKNQSEFPIGILTTAERDEWANTRNNLEAAGNQDLLKAIDGSIFALILDSEGHSDLQKITRQFLHDDGCNRWFDKCFSLIIAKNGIAGINFEHSWGDGVAILRYMTDMFTDSTEKPSFHPSGQSSSSDVHKYVKSWDVVLNDKLKQNINDTRQKFNKTINSLDINLLEYTKMGRNFSKKVQISPDSVIQLAFQVANYKLTGKHVGTYESCSTAAFRHGRTETMRPCTVETSEFCNAITSKTQLTKEKLRKLISICSDTHSNLVKEAAMGHGFDRHLFALRLLAEKAGKIPELYTDPSYQYINKYILSTSTLSTDLVLTASFGPVVQDGYGLGYTVSKERMGIIASTYSQSCNGRDFMSVLNSSLDEIHDILS